MSELYTGPIKIMMTEVSWYEVWRCVACGSLINGKATHDKWHENYARVADDAYWGGMNRPIGGGLPF